MPLMGLLWIKWKHRSILERFKNLYRSTPVKNFLFAFSFPDCILLHENEVEYSLFPNRNIFYGILLLQCWKSPPQGLKKMKISMEKTAHCEEG